MKPIYFAPLLLLLLCTTGVFAEVANFSIFRIPEAPKSFTVQGITDSGVVFGSAFTPGHGKGYFLKNGSFSFFEAPNEQVTQIFGANDNGDFIGTAFSVNGNSIVSFITFVVRNGVMTTLSPPPEFSNLSVSGINNRGVIVGTYFFNGARHGLIIKDGVYTSVDAPGCNQTLLNGINANDEIIGDCNFGQKSFVAKGRNFNFFTYPGLEQITVRGINDRGEMVGAAFTFSFQSPPTVTVVDWVLRNGAFEKVEFFGMSQIAAIGINNSGQIAGIYVITDPNDQTVYGFIRQPK